jgi:hypothetical protein
VHGEPLQPEPMQAAFDPVLLFPPTDRLDKVDDWVLSVSGWTELLGHGPVRGSCPEELQNLAYEKWWTRYDEMTAELGQVGSPYRVNDLLLVWEELRGRLDLRVLPAARDALFDHLAVQPAYVAPALGRDQREGFADHLGALALLRRDTRTAALVFTERASWDGPPDAIEFTGEIAIFADDLGHEAEPEGDAARVREFLVGCCTVSAAHEALVERPERLVHHPELAVRISWRVHTGETDEQLDFKVSEGFVDTLLAMSYDREESSAHAASCWRAMAFIAAGRAGDLSSLEAHPHRQGSGGAPPIRDHHGRTLYRGAVFMGPNAHRLFWWSGDIPEFVGVAGHDDDPPI